MSGIAEDDCCCARHTEGLPDVSHCMACPVHPDAPDEAPQPAQEAADLSSWMKTPHRIAVDAKGYVWRAYGDDAGTLAGYWSMTPVNPDNSPIPRPVTYYVPEERAEAAEAERDRLRAGIKDLCDFPPRASNQFPNGFIDVSDLRALLAGSGVSVAATEACAGCSEPERCGVRRGDECPPIAATGELSA